MNTTKNCKVSMRGVMMLALALAASGLVGCKKSPPPTTIILGLAGQPGAGGPLVGPLTGQLPLPPGSIIVILMPGTANVTGTGITTPTTGPVVLPPPFGPGDPPKPPVVLPFVTLLTDEQRQAVVARYDQEIAKATADRTRQVEIFTKFQQDATPIRQKLAAQQAAGQPQNPAEVQRLADYDRDMKAIVAAVQVIDQQIASLQARKQLVVNKQADA